MYNYRDIVIAYAVGALFGAMGMLLICFGIGVYLG